LSRRVLVPALATLVLTTVASWAIATPSPAPTSKPAALDDVLKSKGLSKVGLLYLLDADAQLPDSLRAIRKAEAQLQTYNTKRRAIEADITKAQDFVTQWEQEIADLNEKMSNQKDTRQYNEMVGESNDRSSKIRQAAKYVEQKEAELKKLPPPPGDQISATLSLAAKMDAAAAKYEELAKDDDVKNALAAIKDKTHVKYTLGPSDQFKSELPKIRKQRDTIQTSAIKLETEGGVPHVPVSINGSNDVAMVVDSGASLVTITSTVADTLHITPQSSDRTATLVVADGKEVKAKVITLDSVRLGPFLAKKVVCAVLPDSVPKDTDCLLGDTFLENFQYQMDLNAGVLHLSPIPGQSEFVSSSAQPGTVDAKLPHPTSTESSPPSAPKPDTLNIAARVDGSDEIHVTRDGLTWSHKQAHWASNIQVNGMDWDARNTPTLSVAAHSPLAFLQNANFAAARVLEKKGRGEVLMESGDDGLTIFFSDGQNGADHYEISISLPRK
jgi:clan AA aspartic protease (TIGR02281 family)